MYRALPSAALLLALAACAPGTPRTLADQYHTYSYTDFFRASDGRDTFVIVRGNPFALDQPALERLVTSGMQAMPRGPRTRYTTAATNDADPDFKVVWLFNGPPTVQADELCRNPTAVQGRGGPASNLQVLAAYCRYDRANTWVSGWLDGAPSGVSREGLERLIAQVTSELFPVVNRQDLLRDRDRCPRPNC